MTKSKTAIAFFILFFFLLNYSTYAQKKLAVTKVKNGHSYFFQEGKHLLCKTYLEEDSAIVSHHGYLAIISDSLIKLDNDTLLLNDIIAVKKYYSAGSKLLLSCLFMYIPVSELALVPVGVGGYFWAVSQGIDENLAIASSVILVYTGAYIINYYVISNSPLFKAFNKVGSKYKLQVTS